MTTTSIRVVLFVSLIFFVSFDSPPTGFVAFDVFDVFSVLLVAADTNLLFNNLSRFLSASRIARNKSMLRITNAKQGNIWTNKTRNLENKIRKHSPHMD